MSKLETNAEEYPKLLDWLRYFCAFMLYMYGISKLVHLQFNMQSAPVQCQSAGASALSEWGGGASIHATGHGIGTVVEPSTRAYAGAHLDASDTSGSRAMSCRRVVLKLHLDSPKGRCVQCALPAQLWSGESVRTASGRGEPPAR
jgi:hypothetical protein